MTNAEMIAKHNETNPCKVVVFHADMYESTTRDGDTQIISAEIVGDLAKLKPDQYTPCSGWWHYWTMPGHLDRSSFFGPYDSKEEAQADAIEMWSIWQQFDEAS